MTPLTMIHPPSRFNHVVAFEVAKADLVVHVLPADEQCRIPNTRQAVRRLLRAQAARNRRHGHGPLLVVCEATGGYERHVLDAAQAFGLATHRAHGSRVRHFASYLGLAAKSDPIDSRMLALYGLNTEGLRLYEPPSPEEAALRALKDRREELQQMLIAETNRLEHATHKSIVAGLQSHIRTLRAALEAIGQEIDELVRSTAELTRKVTLMQSVIGVGPVTATALLAYLPEIGAITGGQAARLCGLAPITRQSGKGSATARTEPGRAGMRRSLYMAAVVAMRRNPALAAFAARLTVKGKPFRLVVTALMRKLVVILNAVLRDGQPCRHATA
jgi:transposase